MRRARAALGALALTALVGAGCGGGAGEGGGAAGGAAGGAGAGSSARDAAVRFSACMREHGVRAFPDPDASGELTVDAVVNGASIDPEGPAWKQAMDACEDLQPAGFTGEKRDAGQQDAALRFAECMRESGVEDFPDPAPGEPLVDTNRIPSSNTPGGMDVLNAAMRTCREAAEKAMAGR